MNDLTDVGWDQALLQRYDRRGPRYTSYPGAHMFEPLSVETHLDAHLSSRARSPETLGLYVHVPFCNDICYYCACNKLVTRDRAKGRQYLDYLSKEIDLYGRHWGGREITSLHLGGGTPNWLDDGELTELVYLLSSTFNLSDRDSREFSVEIDPRGIDLDTIRLLSGLGFNRLSLGVQDFDERVQRAVNRVQSEALVRSVIEFARLSGFRSINYDLIYGLPFQTSLSLSNTVDVVLEHKPDRVALYNYAHLPDRFVSQRAIDRLNLPAASEKLNMLCSAAGRLQENGYRYIGMDHFAREGSDMEIAEREGKLSRGFQGYSIQFAPETIGLGVSAISSLDDVYYQNEKSLEAYYERLDHGELPAVKGVVLSFDDQVRRRVIQSLICELRADKQEIAAEFNIDFDSYFKQLKGKFESAEKDGLLADSTSAIIVTERGRLLLRNICMIFDSTLQYTETRFSQTV